ncbi:MAG: 4Fe-4S dicluster domain-containing protein [Peptococcaceae bacterium]|nr:4Fe-4S dicluster domain-containing protein [Peptococcaceae bacterium]
MCAFKYNPAASREVYNLESGKYAQQCMQCGLCAVTCPARHLMDYTPRQLFKMLFAGEVDKVLKANTPWLCTSCCLCTVRCPRGIPIIDVMHSLKHYHFEKGTKAPVATLSKVFFDSMMKRGRVFELGMTNAYYMKSGFGAIKDAMKMQDVGMAMMKAKRLPLAPPKKVKGLGDVKKIYDKAVALAKEGH